MRGTSPTLNRKWIGTHHCHVWSQGIHELKFCDTFNYSNMQMIRTTDNPVIRFFSWGSSDKQNHEVMWRNDEGEDVVEGLEAEWNTLKLLINSFWESDLKCAAKRIRLMRKIKQFRRMQRRYFINKCLFKAFLKLSHIF